GISIVTLRRAKEALGLRSRRHGWGRQGFWLWYRKEDPQMAAYPSLEDQFGLPHCDRAAGDPLTRPMTEEGRAKVAKSLATSFQDFQERVQRASAELPPVPGYDGEEDDDEVPDLTDEEDLDDEFDEPAPRGARGVARPDHVWKKTGKKHGSQSRGKESKAGLFQRILDSLARK